MSGKTTKEKFEFKTEVNQLLDLVVHSLYSHKDIFLRELLSNASDAIDKVRYQGLTNQDLLEDNSDWKIKLIRDDKKNTLTISDNGIGMTHEDLIKNLGTIAKSGTKEFLENIKKSKESVNLIGQFGVGFYSAFMVADKVEVITKAPQEKAYRWTSDGKGGFDIEEADKQNRGTDVILHLKKESKDYTSEYELRTLVKKYSDFVEFPIVMDIEREEIPKDKYGKEIEKAKPIKKN
jgi:molecular chaperone HtpG